MAIHNVGASVALVLGPPQTLHELDARAYNQRSTR
jgi:hypothetical protein